MNKNPVRLNLVQGRSKDFARKTPNDDGTYGNVFSGSEAITYTVWPADSEVLVLTASGQPNVWLDPTQSAWLISFSDAQTTLLTPGDYRLEVSAPVGTRTAVLFEGTLEVIATAGTTVNAPPDLATAYYVSRLLAQIPLSNVQIEALPDVISAASNLIRTWCGRDFTRSNYKKAYNVALDGYVRLEQIPVNQVYFVQTTPQVALGITNSGPGVTQSWVYATTVGDVAMGLSIVGITLVAFTNGVGSTGTITFTTNQTIQGLADAINALGGGWAANVQGGFGTWPVTALVWAGTGQGATSPSGALISVYSAYSSQARLDPQDGHATGLVWVGRQGGGGGIGPRWGPDWQNWGYGGGGSGDGTVVVSWNGGFDVIPAIVQTATAELTKAILERFKMEAYLNSETAGAYSYTIGLGLYHALPAPVREAISLFRIHNA